MKFSKEEIRLCKEIAKYYRKPINLSYVAIDGKFYLSTLDRLISEEHEYYNPKVKDDALEDINRFWPLWTLQDCLDWLKSQEYNYYEWGSQTKKNVAVFTAIHDNWHELKGAEVFKAIVEEEADTILEAALKAVLAVLKEGK